VKVYFISGLGADSRVFRHIQLPPGFEAAYLDWVKPDKNESLHNYAMRLAERIDTKEQFIIVGLSMGGMMAVEISKLYHPLTTILLSSVPCSAHLPFYYRAAAKLRLHRIVPISVLKSASFVKRFFTAEKDEDKKLLHQLIRDTDPAFIRWAINAILYWDCKDFSCRYIHIHGARDLILPVRYTRPTHVIQKAGHLMVMTKAMEINAILADALKNISTSNKS
jgi:pimeloyl-ACP methyl ester carboxylesterase